MWRETRRAKEKTFKTREINPNRSHRTGEWTITGHHAKHIIASVKFVLKVCLQAKRCSRNMLIRQSVNRTMKWSFILHLFWNRPPLFHSTASTKSRYWTCVGYHMFVKCIMMDCEHKLMYRPWTAYQSEQDKLTQREERQGKRYQSTTGNTTWEDNTLNNTHAAPSVSQ